MQGLPSNQFHRRRDQEDILSRGALPEIDRPLGEGDLIQIRDAARISVNLGKVEELDAGCMKKLAYKRCLDRITHQKHYIHLAV